MKMLKIMLHSALSILYTELEKPQMTLRLSLPNRIQLILRKDHGGEWFEHLYMTTGKTIALTIWTFVGKVMSLLFYNHITGQVKVTR